MPKFAPKIANKQVNKNVVGRMNQTRIDLLKKYIEEDPNDPFNHYGLACEYLSEKPEEALKIFQELLAQHADYLPTYYQTGQLLEAFEREEEALKVYETGMALAKAQNNTKTFQELNSVHQNLLFEME
ncbi:tetratricopeptide repeat protein [Roseivirga sp. E12]|uniref:tetratricopeptide repeat protein n=1 Tax=Roseivirga sp. E12 TaxID=2819237 RepID=UPI001F2A7BE0|nr:tetratricopeptide repeat protein [Roseivirga sp. E12]